MENPEKEKEKKATTTTTPTNPIPKPKPKPKQTKVLNRSPESQTHPKPKPHKLCTTTSQAGWSMNEPAQESNQTQKKKTLVRLRCWFDQFHSALLKEICSLRPIPPILGDSGRVADLFKLFLAVRGKGGCDAVSRGGLWASVAEESGLGLGLAAAVKLVYIKYLDCFERWLDRLLVFEIEDGDDDGDGGLAVGGEVYLMEIQDEFKGFLSEITENRKSGKKAELPYRGGGGDDDDEGLMAVDSESVDSERLSRKRKKSSDGDDSEGLVVDLDSAAETEEERMAGREALKGIVDWVRNVARDPGNPALGALPEPSNWRSEDNADTGGAWKKVLLAREAVFLKRNNESEQKNQRMHPSMYSDQLGSAYNLRERLKSRKKLLNDRSPSQGEAGSESSLATSDLERSMSGSEDQNDKLGTTSSSGADLIDQYSPSRIPTGPAYQAEVPEWTSETSESDPKWLGKRVWPLDKFEQKFLLERDPIGKGRQTSCGCQEAGSVECVRFHVAEKRLRVKRELASAFYLWRFDKMGEDVKMFWTADEEKKFKDIVISNPPSLEVSFWDQISKAFRRKSRADLVSYYYNVFILRRRAHQNRFTPSNIDSDDEELEPASAMKETSETKKSILLTPNKQHRK